MTVSAGSSSTTSSTPASILAFLQDREDSRMVRLPAMNSTLSRPAFTVDSRSTHQATSFTSWSSGSHSQHDSGTSGSVGLTFGASTSYGSGPSISTSIGVRKLKDPLLIQEHIDGPLTPRPPPLIKSYECPFDRLDCLQTFTSFQPWYEHSLTHFRNHEPPLQNHCCFCQTTFDKSSGRRSWKTRLEHVKLHHDRGEQLGTSRFDAELYRYLWSKKLISDIEYKDLTGSSSTSKPTAGSSTVVAGHGSNSGWYMSANDGRDRHHRTH